MPRTTLTLDPDVAKLIEDAVHRERRPTKQVINDALRRGLMPTSSGRRRKFRVVPHQSAVRPGLDRAGFNRLTDELETEEFIAQSDRAT